MIIEASWSFVLPMWRADLNFDNGRCLVSRRWVMWTVITRIHTNLSDEAIRCELVMSENTDEGKSTRDSEREREEKRRKMKQKKKEIFFIPRPSFLPERERERKAEKDSSFLWLCTQDWVSLSLSLLLLVLSLRVTLSWKVEKSLYRARPTRGISSTEGSAMNNRRRKTSVRAKKKSNNRITCRYARSSISIICCYTRFTNKDSRRERERRKEKSSLSSP